jgi:hypothetical protein
MKQVYRHFFDPHGAIECYDMNLIESELNLTRKDTILLAMLLGKIYKTLIISKTVF